MELNVFRDTKDKPVDWWFMYKLPNNVKPMVKPPTISMNLQDRKIAISIRSSQRPWHYPIKPPTKKKDIAHDTSAIIWSKL